jgi:hypothetical protein
MGRQAIGGIEKLGLQDGFAYDNFYGMGHEGSLIRKYRFKGTGLFVFRHAGLDPASRIFDA